jgi:transglutaminase-like putative cysteine protease
MSADELPRPAWYLWRTWLRRRRPLRGIVSPIDTAPLRQTLPAPEEVIPFGEYLLLEDHAYVLHRDGTMTYRIHMMTLLWRSEMLAQWDQVQRVFHPRQLRSTIGKALLHLPEGVTLKQKIDHKVDQIGNHYVHLAFRPLRPGVIVEFEEQVDYFQRDPLGPVMWGNFLLQTGAPCRRRRLTIAVARPFTAYVRQHHGAADPVEEEYREYAVRRWDVQDVPGITMDVMPHARDFLPWIDFTTMRTWGPVCRHLCKELLPQGDQQRMDELVRELTRPEQTVRDKVAAVYQHVARQIRYGRPPADVENRQVRAPQEVLAELRGDCKDKSALLVGLLNRLGVPAQVAVVTTSEGGRTPFLPSMRFNHALVRAELDGGELWIDPAAGPFSLGDLPSNDEGQQALLVDPGGPQFAQVPASRARNHSTKRIYRGRIEADGAYVAEVTVRMTGEPAALLRGPLLDATAEERLKYLRQDLAASMPGCEVREVSFRTLDDLSQPLELQYQIVLHPWARRIRNVWVARFPWTSPMQLTGALAAEDRQQPMPTPRTSMIVEVHELVLPAGVRAYGLPFRREVRNAWLHYRCWIGTRGSKLLAVRRVRFREGMVPAREYRQFRRDWAECALADTTDMLLVQRPNAAGPAI